MTTLAQPAASSLQVGFIGLGDQGAPMAVALAEAGFELHVWARRPASMDALGTVPCTVHDTPATLAAACDVLALCLTDDRDIDDLLHRQSMLDGLRPGTVVVNHGTGDPAANARFAVLLGEAGIGFLDAPVSGGRPGAIARTLTTIVGGDAKVLEGCRPVFDAYSRKIVRMGAAGTGQLGKLLNNAMTMSNLDNVARVLALADQLQLDVPAVADMIRSSSGSSAILDALTSFTPELALHLQGLMKKDIEHFADGMRANGLDPDEMRNRGLHGAESLVGVVERLGRRAPLA
jgi:3-hydroxyisobutyrate dehydrogenase-like beta-hydroxyacid dehydrogenase